MDAQHISQLKDLSQKLATELVFARADDKAAMASVGGWLGQIEQLGREAPLPPTVAEAVRNARRQLDELSAGGVLSGAPETLTRLNAWATWLQQASSALELGCELPPPPTDSQAPPPGTCPAETSADPGQAAPPDTAEPALQIDAAADAELLREFLNESVEHLQNIEQGVLALEENPTDSDALQSLFRAFHTFKGSAGFLNLAPVQKLAHQLESLLDAARNRRLTVTPAVADLILAGGDRLKQFLTEIDARISGAGPTGPIIVPTLDLLDSIRAVLAQGTPPAPAAAPATCREKPPAAAPPAPAPTAEVVSTPAPVPPNTSAHPPATPGPAAPASPDLLQSTAEGRPSKATHTTSTAIKVDTTKLDNLMDLVGELVIAQSLVSQNPALRSLADRQLNHDLAQLGRITKELQRTVMALRMVPIRSTFQKMNRLVRDLCAKTGKQVDLAIEGEDTEVDRTLVEELSDPLVHMLRNAVDHGIEPPEERRQRHKPPKGRVTLRAYHQGGNIVLEVSDDGRGLDPQRLFSKAVQTGIVRADARLSNNEVLDLIFAPGFSTAEKVTDLSGRGVGMDVVRRNIEKLRGKVEVRSEPGRGTTFVIYLPLTLAIIEGLIVSVGDQRCIVPALAVSETFRPTRDMIHTVQGRGEIIQVRGRLCPVLRLHQHLGVRQAPDAPDRAIALVVQAGQDWRCVLVDEILGKQEVVIKNLGGAFRHTPAVAGGAILGDGRVGLILDPNALVHLPAEIAVQAA